MAEKTRLTEAQRIENNETIERIKVITENLRIEVEKFHGNYIREAYDNSVSNLDVKNVKYFVKAEIKLNEEEAELIQKYRDGLLSIKEKKVVS